METTDLGTAMGTAVSEAATQVTTMLGANLPTVLGVAGAILAIGIVWRVAKSFMKQR